ncbi:WXG100 family type VII secretion target [Nocardia salmonicida]|uniref:WXG100 family type VII secretion target n=1 Tax=Nocardia salmonicida TaxID=53431 RepID=UPI002E2B6FE4|nr:WXG100 family type VII secretion target [Nocardia salmonicida]
MSDVIASNRDSVDLGAQDMIATANQLGDKLIEFHKKVEAIAEKWGGSAHEAFTQMQGEWHSQSGQLNTTLQEAAKLVQTGNSELHDTDKWLSGKFV